MDDSSKGGYDNILGRYLLTSLGLNINLLVQVIEAVDGNFKGCTASIIDLGT